MTKDDGSATVLLDKSFVRQLQPDGIRSRLTFICAMTGEISVSKSRNEHASERELQLEMAGIHVGTAGIGKQRVGWMQRGVDVSWGL